ncbi:uncharacterized protein LOC128392787 isoform X2 [Panonychus citri]|uniref:uncharacterized protein LOC128392787 isoform X2 n=1 Tax=Panonychus citri TaxID=50023 RepID=UPI002307D892|nr:uncharacterized protein LOC128392787 isoform X2 [Panonychus citri]
MIRLITFFGLLSVCFALSLPREFLGRICEIVQKAERLGLSRETVNQMAIEDFEQFIGYGLSSELQRDSNTRDNTDDGGWHGFQQKGLVLGLLRMILDLFRVLLMGNFNNLVLIQESVLFPNLFKPAEAYLQISEMLTTAGQQVSSVLDSISCSQFDFPEKIDPTNETDVRQAIIHLIQSGLKLQEEKLKQLENTFTDIQEKLFPQQIKTTQK